MTDFKIEKIHARWVLDSRGNPTVECDIYADGKMGRAAVPSGASTGELEALELRDGGEKFMGKGVSQAVNNVNNIIAKKLKGMDVVAQNLIDKKLLELDGTDNKERLGANAILSVSLAAAKLAAKLRNIPLYQHIFEISYGSTREDFLMPLPCCNILNGGEHAGNDLSIQEFMILPKGANSFSTAIRWVSEVYHTLKGILAKKYGPQAINVGDEGGFAPNFSRTNEAMDVIIEAIEERGFSPGKEFVIAIDAAASEFFKEGKYNIDEKKLNEDELLEYYLNLIKDYPLTSIEDPFDQTAFSGFSKLTDNVDKGIQIVDDDLTVTNIKILKKAIETGAGNALLLKVNQIGSLTEAIEAAKMSFDNNFNVMVSHRSGETEDPFIADLAVGLCSGQIKSGAPCRSDRCSKYNQLLRIEEELKNDAVYPSEFNSWKDFQ
ncbi:MAG: phosphopyruvate hydratase [Candidatus Lokiarchaeota archaeon]|nr:phosphopyruvate hydratase [Candidatus Lokiarchaeota archaeon]